MITTLNLEIIEYIVSFISHEMVIVLFPKRSEKKYHPLIYGYEWIIGTEKIFHRPLIYWLARRNIIPKTGRILDFTIKMGYHVEFKKLIHMIPIQNLHNHISYKLVDWACVKGYVDILNWWYEFCEKNNIMLFFIYSQNSIDIASRLGHIQILEWWVSKKNVLTLSYTKRSIDYTYNIEVLEWWLYAHKFYNLEMKYSVKHLDNCLDEEVFDWWIKNGLQMKYTSFCINNCSKHGRIDLLDWWYKITRMFFLPFKYTEYAVDTASANGNIMVLNWWYTLWEYDRVPFLYTHNAMDLASANGHFKILEWWLRKQLKSKLSMKWTVDSINRASRNGCLEVLNWWLIVHNKYNVKLLYDERSQENIQPRIKKWWKNFPYYDDEDYFFYKIYQEDFK